MIPAANTTESMAWRSSGVHLETAFTTISRLVTLKSSTPFASTVSVPCAAVVLGCVGELEPAADEWSEGWYAGGDDANVLLEAVGEVRLDALMSWIGADGDGMELTSPMSESSCEIPRLDRLET
jgi:hypothetical protein